MRFVHASAGASALIIIAVFWFATVSTELIGATVDIIAVKTGIAWGLLLLVPVMAVAGGSGHFLSKGRVGGAVSRKRGRMPFIAVNGLLILVPSALFLASAARAHQFDLAFYLVQTLELAAGVANIVLLVLNMKDGLRMRQRAKAV